MTTTPTHTGDRTARPSNPSWRTSFVERIERAEWLDGISRGVRPGITRVAGSGRRRDVMTGGWLGHPAHPAVIAFPTGCWLSAGVLDAVGGSATRSAARILVGVGVLTAAPAVATGAADWLDTDGAERRIGAVHAIGNLTATLLYAGSWLARRRNHHRTGVVLAVGGAALAAGAGYLGGHLAYVRGVGVNTTAFESGPTEWTPVELHGELDTPRRLLAGQANGVALVVVHDADDADVIRVLEDRCTHRGGPLHDGEVVGGCLVCPWHGTRFDIKSGEIRQGPASIDQPVYDVRLDDTAAGQVLLVRRTEEGGLRKNPVTTNSIK